MLKTCSFAPPPCNWKSSSYLCRTLLCLPLLPLLLLLLLVMLVLSVMMLHVASLTTPQWSWPVNCLWRSCSNISMGPPRPIETPRGSNWNELSCSDLSQWNVSHKDCSFRGWVDTSSSILLRHPLTWYSESHITQSTMEERAKVPSSFDVV